MEISPVLLSFLLLYSFLLGGAVGVTDDAFCVICKRSRQKVKAVVRCFSDILLCLLFSAGIILLNYYFNKGSFRAFTAFGAAAGVGIYKKT